MSPYHVQLFERIVYHQGTNLKNKEKMVFIYFNFPFGVHYKIMIPDFCSHRPCISQWNESRNNVYHLEGDVLWTVHNLTHFIVEDHVE